MNFPYTREGDYCFALTNFIRFHKRMPRMTGGSMADALFHILTTNEILDPLRVFVSDKVYLRDFVKSRIGDEYNVPILAVIDSPEALGRFSFPQDCVIKPAHMSGEVIFRKGGAVIDMQKVIGWLKSNFYASWREANYRYLHPRIVVEPYVFDSENVIEYKYFCVNGKPLLIAITSNRRFTRSDRLYTTDWECLPCAYKPKLADPMPKPQSLSLMLEIAAKLSEEFNLVRVDLYSDGKKVQVGEITNCTSTARFRIHPPEYENLITSILFGSEGFSPDTLKKR